MHRIVSLSLALMIACSSGCRIHAGPGVSAEAAQETQDEINAALDALASLALIGLANAVGVPRQSHSKPKAKHDEVYEAWVKSVLDADRKRAAQDADATWIEAAIAGERQRLEIPPPPPVAAPPRKALPAGF